MLFLLADMLDATKQSKENLEPAILLFLSNLNERHSTTSTSTHSLQLLCAWNKNAALSGAENKVSSKHNPCSS